MNTSVSADSNNLILVDWFSCSFPQILNEIDMLNFLELPASLNWEVKRGPYGYKNQLKFNNLSICWGHPVNNGCFVEMTGAGCRTYETYSDSKSVYYLLQKIQNVSYHISRLDLAFDDHTNIFDIWKMKKDVECKNYVSTCKDPEIEIKYGTEYGGITIYFGKPSSNARIRIYDKAKQLNKDEHWNRIELQLRNEYAMETSKLLLEKSSGDVFRGLLSKRVTMKKPNKKDSNKSRWENREYWDEIVQGCEKISLITSCDETYNLADLNRFVIGHCGKSIKAYVSIHGINALKEELDKISIGDLNTKLQALIDKECEKI